MMATHARVQPLVQITDPDIQAGFEEGQEPYYADRGIRTEMGLVEVVRAILTEYAVVIGLSEQQLRRQIPEHLAWVSFFDRSLSL